MNSFLNLDLGQFKNKRVILDVDGTLVSDRGRELSPQIIKKMDEFKRSSEIYLFSNALPERTHQFAADLGVFYCKTTYRKPSIHVVDDLPETRKKIIVIGDKYITDGRFAQRIGADFVKVRRLRSFNEKVLTRVTYACDDILWWLLPYIRLCRPFQWPKNMLVFVPLFFGSLSYLSLSMIYKGLIAFILFSIAASIVYIFNDFYDIDADKLHPHKRHRPLASGALGVGRACLFMLMLVGMLFLLLSFYPALIPVIGIYFILNIFYTLLLKRIPGFDIICVALFYYLRILAGEALTSVSVDPLIIVCIFSGALFIISGKRRAEFMQYSKRKVLDSYSLGMLNGLIFFTSITIVGSYVGYVLKVPSLFLLISVACIISVVGRILIIIYLFPRKAEVPELLLFKDRWILINVIVWVLWLILLKSY